MLPTLNSLTKLAAFACHDNEHAKSLLWNRPDGEELQEEVAEAVAISHRLSIYQSLQDLIRPKTKVLIDGLIERPELNNTEGTALSWKSRENRWAVQPASGGRPILLRSRNLLPIFSQQSAELELQDLC